MTRVAVIGGGLAGTLIVQACRSRGVASITWFDGSSGGRGSDVPCALVHPFVGRSFQPQGDLAEAWRCSRVWLEQLPEEARVHRAFVRRWLDPRHGGDRLERSFAQHREVVDAMVTSMEGETAGQRWIEYGPAYGFALGDTVTALGRRLQAAGITPVPTFVQRLEPSGSRWRLHTTAASMIEVDTVFVAAGLGTYALVQPWSTGVALRAYEGTLCLAEAPPLERFHIDAGHLASSRTHWAWGSSYRALDRSDDGDSHAQLAALTTRLFGRACEVSPPAAAVTWSGVRVALERSRGPWARELRPGLFVLSALGSKGGLWGPWLAQRLAEAV